MNELHYATALFKAFEDCSTTTGGITRETYGEGENRAHKVFQENARGFGLKTYVDAALNTWTGSPRGLPVVIGSHLDSVPMGGNFDGAAGVVAGLLVAARMKGKGVQVVALRGEESAWFGECYLGSKAVLVGWSADRSAQTLDRKSRTTGKTLNEMFNGRPWQALRDPKSIRAFLELHIEQGPVLEGLKIPLGIVTGIRGNVRHTVTCTGEAGHSGTRALGHSGTTPMEGRKDAVAATVDLLYRWNQRGRMEGLDLVLTTGVIHTDPLVESVSSIAGKVTFTTEWRSLSKQTLRSLSSDFKVLIGVIEKQYGVSFSLSAPISSAPAAMSQSVQRAFAQSVIENRRVGDPAAFYIMPSGAGHDAAVFAKAGVPTGMLFVRNQNGSHNPMEAMNMDDFMAGVDLLHAATVRLAK